MSLSEFVIKTVEKNGCDNKELLDLMQSSVKGIQGVSEMMVTAGATNLCDLPNDCLYDTGRLLSELSLIANSCLMQLEGDMSKSAVLVKMAKG